MTAMLIKNRARKPLAVGRVGPGWYRHGVGGFPGVARAVCIGLQVGEYRLFITELEWRELVETTAKMMAADPASA